MNETALAPTFIPTNTRRRIWQKWKNESACGWRQPRKDGLASSVVGRTVCTPHSALSCTTYSMILLSCYPCSMVVCTVCSQYIVNERNDYRTCTTVDALYIHVYHKSEVCLRLTTHNTQYEYDTISPLKLKRWEFGCNAPLTELSCN